MCLEQINQFATNDPALQLREWAEKTSKIRTGGPNSMSIVQLDIPEEVLISLKETPETISQELSMLAAVKLFELGKLSSGRAA